MAYVSFLTAAINVLIAVPLVIIGLRRHRRGNAVPVAPPPAGIATD